MTERSSLPPDVASALLQPDAYPWHPDSIEFIETHISWIFLAGDRVVKVKRPVVYPFVDHRTLASRHQSCLDEVRLNRRLTDGVYLDVIPIVQTPVGLRVDDCGTPVEWATLMRRLPDSGMLDGRLRAGDIPGGLANRLARRLIPFHRGGSPGCGTTPAVASMATQIVMDNLHELELLARPRFGNFQLGLVTAAMRDFVRDRQQLLRERATSGWIREGHGDLRTEHVCLEPDGALQIFDCVEFNRDLRCADVASDLAFLLMDLTRYDAPHVAATLVDRYRDAGFDLPDELLRFYAAHRALVRAKVACMRLAADDPTDATGFAVKAADYLDLAMAFATTVRPLLIAMTGLSGTGKSTAAQRLGRALGAQILTSDVVRKALAGVRGAAPAAWQEGIYRPEATRATYDQLFAFAAAQLTAGVPVVLDAAFLSGEQRVEAAAVATRAGARFVLAETVCDEATVAARLAARAVRGSSPSDATLETYRRQRAAIAATPPVVPPGALNIRIDTSGDLPIHLEPLFAVLRQADVVLPKVSATPAFLHHRPHAVND
jgi:aminoglycoside phosphotransferase family enzyme/predicted kinase